MRSLQERDPSVNELKSRSAVQWAVSSGRQSGLLAMQFVLLPYYAIIAWNHSFSSCFPNPSVT
jgi:hypothetical protein